MFFCVCLFFSREAAGLECVCLCFPERHYVEPPQPLLVYMRPFLKLLPRRRQRLEINTAWSSERLYLFILTWLIHRKFSLSSRVNKNTLQQFSFVVWGQKFNPSACGKCEMTSQREASNHGLAVQCKKCIDKKCWHSAAKHWWSKVFVGFTLESVLREVLITLVLNKLDISQQFLNSVQRRFHWLKI